MKFIIDMNLSTEWVSYLVDHSIDVAHWSEIGPIDAKDADIAAHAAKVGACIITHDLDFANMVAASGSSSPSVVQVRGARVLPHNFGPDLVAALRSYSDVLQSGAIVTIQARGTRFRVLPVIRQ